MSEVVTFIVEKEENGEIQILNYAGFDMKRLIMFTAEVVKNLAEFSPYYIERDEGKSIIRVTSENDLLIIRSSEKKKETIQILSRIINKLMRAVK